MLLQFTDAGRAVFEKAVVILLEVNAKLVEGVPEESRRATARVLMQVVENLAPSPLERNGIIHFSREGLGSAAG